METNFKVDVPSFALGYSAGKKKGGSGGTAKWNFHFSSDTPPEDTSKIWVKTDSKLEISKINVVSSAKIGTVSKSSFALTNSATSMQSTAIANVEGKVYRFGGKVVSTDTTSPIILIDPENDTETVLEATIPVFLSRTVCGVVGKKVYLFGGYDGTNYYDTIYVFDTETEQLSTLSHVTLPKAGYGMACGSYGTKIYLVGGIYEGSASGSVYVFDTEAETIDLVSTVNSIYDSACAVIGSKMYIFHGRRTTSQTSSSYSPYFNRFDMETETYHQYSKASSQGYAGTCAIVYGSKVYAVGGKGYSSNNANVDVYEFGEKDWERTSYSTGSTYYQYMSSAGVFGRTAWLFDGVVGSSTNKNKYGLTVEEFLPEGEANAIISTSSIVPAVDVADNINMKFTRLYVGDENDNAVPYRVGLYKNGEWVNY